MITAAGAYFLLHLMFTGGAWATYDADFKTMEECVRMGDLYLKSGLGGDVKTWYCEPVRDA